VRHIPTNVWKPVEFSPSAQGLLSTTIALAAAHVGAIQVTARPLAAPARAPAAAGFDDHSRLRLPRRVAGEPAAQPGHEKLKARECGFEHQVHA
jgi:hypothetical protein